MDEGMGNKNGKKGNAFISLSSLEKLCYSIEMARKGTLLLAYLV